jgi:phosphatidate phosphatase APP1
VDGKTWTLEVHGCVYEPENRAYAVAALQRMLAWHGVELTEAEQKSLATRARLFMRDNERGRRVVIRYGARLFDLGKTSANGHFSAKVQLQADEIPSPTNRLWFAAELPPRSTRRFVGQAVVLPPTGYIVISDIDDTIKVSEITDRKRFLRKTFVDPFEAVPGMASVYQGWATHSGAVFLYVSASPWQLFPPLQEFIRSSHFPEGPFYLKHFRLKDRSFRGLWEDPQVYKPRVIEPLLEQFAAHRFVLVGDSGEKDPEIYAALQLRHPKQIARIYIRDTTGEGADAERYRKVFEKSPSNSWRIFKDPAELTRDPLPR